IEQVLARWGWRINTAFVERLNLDIRQCVAAIGRRVNTLCQSEAGLRDRLGTFENKTSPLLWYTPGTSFLEESPWNSRTRSRRCSSRQQNRSRAVPDGCLWPAPSKSWGLGDNGVRNVNSGGAG